MNIVGEVTRLGTAFQDKMISNAKKRWVDGPLCRGRGG
jgi:hypothetical protein